MAEQACYDADWEAMKVHLKEAWRWAGPRIVLWYEFDPVASAPFEDDTYDDVEDPQYKAAVGLQGFFEKDPSKEQMKAWGIDSSSDAVLSLNLLLLEDAGLTVTLRDRFSVDGASYQVHQLLEPTGHGEHEEELILGLKQDKESE